MAIINQNDWNIRDIYFYYDYEEYYLKYEFKNKKFKLKSKKNGDEYERSFDNRLVNDITRFGDEITKEQYDNISL